MAEYIERKTVIEVIQDNCYHENLVNEIKAIPAADVQPVKWIPVADWLPDFEGSLLCMRKTVFGFSVQEVLYYEDGEFSYDGIDKLEDGTVTHWMPLPKPPKDGET